MATQKKKSRRRKVSLSVSAGSTTWKSPSIGVDIHARRSEPLEGVPPQAGWYRDVDTPGNYAAGIFRLMDAKGRELAIGVGPADPTNYGAPHDAIRGKLDALGRRLLRARDVRYRGWINGRHPAVYADEAPKVLEAASERRTRAHTDISDDLQLTLEVSTTAWTNERGHRTGTMSIYAHVVGKDGQPVKDMAIEGFLPVEAAEHFAVLVREVITQARRDHVIPPRAGGAS